MNRIYKVIWSKVKHQYVVVSELAHSCTKSTSSRIGRSAAAVLAALVLTTGLCAAPVQAEDLTDPYALLNTQVEETNSTSSDKLVTLVQSPLVKSVAPLANEDEGQPGEGGSSTVTTPDGQHTIYNEEGFYAHNGQGTYNSLTKDGLFVGGTDNGEGLYVDNDGNIYTDGNAEIEGSFSAADGNATIAADGTTVIRAGGSQLVVKDGAAGITHGNAIMAVSSNKAEMQGGGSSVIADLNGVTLTERTGNTTVTVNQDGMTVGGDFAVTGNTNLKHTNVDGDLNVSGSTHVDGGLTAGNLQTEGQLHAGSAVIDRSATVGGKLTAGDVKTNTVDAHNVSVDNELTAGKATIDGKLTAGSAEITNSATVGGTLTAGSLSTEGKLTAGSAAINGNADITGTATVGGLKTEGKVTATNAEITNLKAGKADVEGIVRGGSFANTNDSFTVDDQGDVKAHNVTLTGTLSVRGDTTLTGALNANGTATFAQGASMGGKKITNVGDGEVNANSTDAVNGRQLQKVADTVKTYQAGNGIAIANGATQTPTISAKAADGGNIVVDANGISLSKTVSGLTSIGTDALTVNNNATLSGTLGVAGATTLDSTLSVRGDTTLTGALNANGTATFAQGASMGGKKITNVGDGEVNANSTDAVNGRQLQKVADTVKTYQAGNGIAIANGATQTPTISAKAANGGNIVVNADGISLAKDVRDLTSIGTETITASGAATVGSLTTTGAISGGSVTAGTGLFSTSVTIGNATNGLKLADGEITGLVTSKIDASTDAVNVEYLQDYVSKNGTGKTYTAGNGIVIDGSNVVSVKNGDGIAFDSNGNVEVKAAQDGNIVVDTKGVSLSKTVSGLTSLGTDALTVNNNATVRGTLGVTGGISGGSVTAGTGLFSTSVTIGNTASVLKLADGEITGLVTNKIDSDTDAVNVKYLEDYVSKNGTGKTYTAGNGIAIDEAGNNKISVKTAADGNLEVGSNGVALKDNISLTSVMTSGAVTVGGILGVTGATTLGSTLNVTGATTLGALTTNGTATFSQGASMNGQKITDVQAGTEGTDAVNRNQLDAVEGKIKTYTAGDGIDITSDEISVKSADNNIVVDETGVSLADDISVTSVATTGAANVGGNLSVAGTTTLTGATTINSTLGVTGAVTAASVTAAGGFTINDFNSLTSKGLMIGGTQYITSDGLSAGGKVITNVNAGVGDNDAVNVSQLKEVKDVTDLAVTYTANTNKSQVYLQGTNGTTITNVAAGNISSADSKDAVNGGQLYATNQIVGNGDYSSNNFLIDSTAAGGMDLTKAASALDKAIGNNHYTGSGVLETNTTGQNYDSITDAVSALDLKIGNLTFDEQNVLKGKQPSVTAALSTLNGAIGSLDFKTGMNYIASGSDLTQAARTLDTTLSAVANAVGVRPSAEGGLSTTIDWGDSSISEGETVVGAIKKIDGRVTTLETAGNALSTFSTSNISTLSALSNMDMSAVNTLSSLSADDLAAISTLSEDGSVPAANSDPNSRPGRGPSSGSEDSSTHDGKSQTMDHDLNVTGDVSVGGTLDVTGEANFGSNVNVSGDLDVTGETNMHGTLNMNDNKITGVKDGDISADSTDAVNGSQLWQTNQQVAANTENIGILGSAVNKLGDRIERVGAGAAALAALHPLDFDPDNKLDFAAGFGNYRGASAVAVGAFYRPSENVMFSVGGAFGGGEDMVNAGVSFKVGAGSGSATTSRTAMAKSLKSMQEVVASQDAQLAQQREQIDKLTAMVELLMEQNGQAQPKDGDAQAAQPQQ